MEGRELPHEGLPTEFPVFPLHGALLLPHGKLPLNIFEKRYLAMVEDALAGQRIFGMIQPDVRQRDGATGPALFGVGCLGRLSSFSETEDGRYLIAVNGIIRFDVVNELELRRGYRRLVGDYSRFADDMDAPSDTMTQRATLLAALRAYFTANGFDANWEAIDGMKSAELVTTLCMVCPFGPVEKQALLEAPTLAVRIETLMTLLQMGTHGGFDERPDRTLS